MSQVEEALRLRACGLNVLAAPERQKSPAASWKRWQTELVTERWVTDQFSHGPRNLFVVTGVVSCCLVLDCDLAEAEAWWRERIGEAMEATACSVTGKGHHYWFRLPEGTTACKSWKGEGFDVQADGKGVVAPPSIHPSGKRYEWLPGRGPETMIVAPALLLKGEGGSYIGPSGASLGDGAPRSTLRWLLSHPSAEGGRNDWLSRVAGHLATRFREEDLFDFMVRWAAERLPEPLPEPEIDKLIVSIWETERSKLGKVQEEDREWRILQPTLESGWLASGGFRLLTPCKVDDEGTIGLDQWADADFRVLGVMRPDQNEEEEGELTYDVEIRHQDGRVEVDQLPASTLGDGRALARWLAVHDIKQITPDRITPRGGGRGERLHAYLSAQDAPDFRVVSHLGWHSDTEAFITHDGLIRADGPAPYESVKPSVRKDRANYHYGFGGQEESRRVLAEVLTFHDETITAVFGAWWAAVLLKPQLMAELSQFPFMAIEAPSESGKSTGFFSMLLELGGGRDGQMQSTRAATRDFLTAHNSGIVWVDDLDDPAYLMELVRGSTTGTTISKKGIDHTSQVKAELRGALVLSGEALGMGAQKALADRALLLEVPNPKNRRSLKDESRPQWEDIVAMRHQYPDLTAFSGEYVVAALRWARDGGVASLRSLRSGSGRYADKIAVVRAGARLLAQMSGVKEVIQRVDDWTLEQHDSGSENTLTLKVIPTILRSIGHLSKPEAPDASRGQVATPVLVRGDEIWFSPSLCADWWEMRFRGRVNQRTETVDALTQQARAAKLGGIRNVDRKSIRYSTNDGSSIYWRIPADLSATIIGRSQGDGEEKVKEGQQMMSMEDEKEDT